MVMKNLKIHYASGLVEQVLVCALMVHNNGNVDLFIPGHETPVGPIHEDTDRVVKIESY